MMITQSRLDKILKQEFLRGLEDENGKPDNILNNFNFDLVIAENKIKMDRYITYSNKENDILYIDFHSSDMTELDKFQLSIDVQKKYYDFDYCFINPSTHEVGMIPSGFRNTGILVVENIKLKEIK